MEPNSTGLRCTACALTFPTSAAHRAHYQADFHRYNLKRRTTGLGPVSEADFLRRRAAAQSLSGEGDGKRADFHARCTACNRSFSSRSTLQQHLQSKKHLLAVRKEEGPSLGGLTLEDEEEPEQEVVPSTAAAMQVEPPSSEAGVRGLRPPSEKDLSAETCIFCNVGHGSAEENAKHMHRDHGFFIPDAEYLVDLPGLIRYCNEKVKVGCLCLYCNGKGKSFRLYGDVQKHMTSKCHCKLRYEDGEDLHEFRPFYDFTASYAKAGGSSRKKQDKMTIVDSDGEEWEAVTDDEEEEGGSGDDEEEDDEEGSRLAVAEELYISELGELQLPDGRLLGCRDLSRYYKQRYRPDDMREAVVASRAETSKRLLAIAAGEAGGSSGRGGQLSVGVPREAVMRKAAMLQQMRLVHRDRLRVQLARNRFHKRPQIDG